MGRSGDKPGTCRVVSGSMTSLIISQRSRRPRPRLGGPIHPNGSQDDPAETRGSDICRGRSERLLCVEADTKDAGAQGDGVDGKDRHAAQR
jgi:hypothetical protein